MFKNYLKALYQCFFNPELYRHVVYRWKSASGIGFASIVVTLFSIVTVVNLTADFPPIIDKFVNYAALSAPKSYVIKDGVLTIDKPLPYSITFKQIIPPDIQDEMDTDSQEKADESDDGSGIEDDMGDKPIVIFKESVSVDEVADYPDGIVLIGKDKVITSKKDGEIRVRSFDSMKDVSFNLDEHLPFNLDKALGLYRYIVAVFLWLFLFAAMWIAFIIKAFIVALLSYPVTLIVPEKSLILNDRFRIAIFALAPVYIIAQIVGLFDIVIGFWTVEMVALLYFATCVLVAKRTKTLLEDEPQ